MKVCDICGRPSVYNTTVTTESHDVKKVDLCSKCYHTHYQKEQMYKHFAYKETIEEARDSGRFVDANKERNNEDELELLASVSDKLHSSIVGGSKLMIMDNVFYVNRHFVWAEKLVARLFLGIKIEDHYYK